ncbi:hypothetical protein Tco_1279050 [Tanacetum coccineum]|uniref:Uncharacterized protein n=1 Tax=Tanacetum coccineum TaxID=301880 RepID=A0ABQ4WCC8_9ASTR
MNKVANNQTFEELVKAIKEVTLIVRNLSAPVDGSLRVMKELATEAPCYNDLRHMYSTEFGVARKKKKVVEETTFHESNKLDFRLGSGAYGEDEDLGQKRIHDSDETREIE